MKKIISVVGARPNFMKLAPIHRELKKYDDKILHMICHTGQHYDRNMSKVFFEDLELPKPDFYLGVGSGSHSVQTAKVMIEFEKVVLQEKPDMVIVLGDVNSTIACGLVAVKLNIPLVHVEAGLRSFDRTMPEEINRILTDAISSYLFVTEESGIINLRNEGVSEDKYFLVGNTMIDSLIHYLPKIELSKILKKLHLENTRYLLTTLHRPSNVDDPENIKRIFSQFEKLSNELKIVFPIHPRTKNNLINSGIISENKNILLIDPVGYIDFIKLIKESALVLTDSGGIQEETTYLKKLCLTLRDNTERPVTCQIGTNRLIGTKYDSIYDECLFTLNKNSAQFSIPPLWDGHAAERIVEILIKRI